MFRFCEMVKEAKLKNKITWNRGGSDHHELFGSDRTDVRLRKTAHIDARARI